MRSSRRFFPRLAPIVLFGLSLFLLAGCAGNSGPAADQTTTEPAVEAPIGADDGGTSEADADDSAQDPTGAQAADEDRVSVDIADFLFSPAELRIKAGTIVVWTNKDGAPHQVHADDDAYQLSVISQGGQSEQVFSAPGTYTYHCHLHPNMQATVIVE